VLTPQQALASKPKVLRAPSALECELRVVIWGVHELEFRGKSKALQHSSSADVFVTVQAGQGPLQESDVHHGVRDYAEFNWRYLFDMQLPTRHTKLNVQVWDVHSTGANDSLAECVLQIGELYANVEKAHRMHEIPRQFYTLSHPLYMGQQGKIDMSISMMPRAVAEELDNIAGMGRGSPNQNPYLPPPNRASQASEKASLLNRISLNPKTPKADALGFSSALPASTAENGAIGADNQAGENGGPPMTEKARRKAEKDKSKQRKQARANGGLAVDTGEKRPSLLQRLRFRNHVVETAIEQPEAPAGSPSPDPRLKV